jgi:WD40 repeat protein
MGRIGVESVRDAAGGRPLRRPSACGSWALVLTLVVGFAACYDRATRTRDRPKAVERAAPEAQVGREEYDGAVWRLAYSPTGDLLAVITNKGGVALKETATGRPIVLSNGGPSSARVLAFTPDGRTLAVAGQGPVVRLWDARTAREWPPLHVRGGTRVDGLAFSPDGARLTVGLWDGPLADWDWRRGRRLDGPGRPIGGVTAVALAPDGATLATGDAHGRVVVWGPSDPRGRAAAGHRNRVGSLAFAPDGRSLASASPGDATVCVSDAATGALKYTLTYKHTGVTSVAFSPDGTLLAAAHADGEARLFDAATGRPRGVAACDRMPYALAFSPDGATLATGDHGGSVRFWSVARLLKEP